MKRKLNMNIKTRSLSLFFIFMSGRKIVFSYGFCRDSDMEDSMKKFVIEMCVSNLEKYSDNSLVSFIVKFRPLSSQIFHFSAHKL